MITRPGRQDMPLAYSGQAAVVGDLFPVSRRGWRSDEQKGAASLTPALPIAAHPGKYPRHGEERQLTTKLDSPLKRELSLQGKLYTLTISPVGLNLVPKGRRKGYELAWIDLVSGDAALAKALNASLARGPDPEPVPGKPAKPKPPEPGARRPGKSRSAR